MFQFSTKFAITEAPFSWCSWLPWVLYLLCKTTLLVLLAGGEVGFLTYTWSGTFTSPTVIGSPRSTCFPDIGQPSETWRLGYYLWVARPCLSESFCIVLYNVKQVLLSYIQDWVRSMEEQEHNSRTRRNMNWSDGSVLVNCGIQNWGTCFSTICKLELLSEVTLSFFCLKCGKLEQLLFWSRIVIKLYASSFLTELCTFMTGWGLSFASQVKPT